MGLVLAGATVLVLGALSVPMLFQWLRGSAETTNGYQVGDCVVRVGEGAETTACDAPDAYKIVAQVDGQEQCDDLTQPVLELPGPPARFFCLVRIEGAPAADEPTEVTPIIGDADG